MKVKNIWQKNSKIVICMILMFCGQIALQSQQKNQFYVTWYITCKFLWKSKFTYLKVCDLESLRNVILCLYVQSTSIKRHVCSNENRVHNFFINVCYIEKLFATSKYHPYNRVSKQNLDKKRTINANNKVKWILLLIA